MGTLSLSLAVPAGPAGFGGLVALGLCVMVTVVDGALLPARLVALRLGKVSPRLQLGARRRIQVR